MYVHFKLTLVCFVQYLLMCQGILIVIIFLSSNLVQHNQYYDITTNHADKPLNKLEFKVDRVFNALLFLHKVRKICFKNYYREQTRICDLYEKMTQDFNEANGYIA